MSQPRSFARCVDVTGSPTPVAAVDLGATSGRVVVATLDRQGIAIEEVARFPNGPVQASDGSWVWPLTTLYDAVVCALARARDRGVTSWGIDSWGVDFGVVRDGALVGPVRAHRDPRHASGMAVVDEAMPWPTLYAHTGIQRIAINTIYQIAAEDPRRIDADCAVLMVPDLLAYWATGVLASDVTDASTTGMVDPRTRQWSRPLLDALDLPPSAFLPLDEPGVIRGPATDPRVLGLDLIGVATHDTASAFAGAPVQDRDRALILSLGTWALIGAEVVGAEPDDAARAANVTHELGVDGTVRVLGNVTGMWLLEECRRAWALEDGTEPPIADLVDAACRAKPLQAVFDVDNAGLAAPGQSEHTIARLLVGAHDGTRGAVVRSLLESMVVRLAQRADEIEALLGTPRPVLHVVGGASRIDPLMQWLADASGREVVAGPVEATAIGNAVLQWRALGVVHDLAAARSIIGGMPQIRTFRPQGDHRAWAAFGERLAERFDATRTDAPR